MKHDNVAVLASLRQQAEKVKAEWARRGKPDARAALAEHPDLAADRSLVLDLAYEEYCLRKETGEDLDPEDFCARFPVHRTSIRRLLGAHQLFEDNPRLLDEAPHWPAAGEPFGDYTLLRELGRGAFARVFLALERSTGDRPVVVKLSAGGGAEARTLGRLAHPHVVHVLSARLEAAAGLTVVCMPYLGNATLHDLLDRAFPTPDAPPPRRARVLLDAIQATAHPADPAIEPPPPPPSRWLLRGRYVDGVVHLAVQMAEALAFLHGRQVIHRDLKPSNVLLSPDGRALLLDFNLSAAGDASDARLGGTLPYMAPEQIEAFLIADCGLRIADSRPRNPQSADARCDLFALGVLVYELLTGVHPFGPVPLKMPAEQLARWLLDRQRAGHTALRRLNPGVDPAVARVIERCLAPDPAERPASAAEVADVLKAYLDRRLRLRRLRPRRWLARWPLLLLTAGCLLLAIGYTFFRNAAEEYQLGVRAFMRAKFLEAEGHFDRCIRAAPNESKAYFARGHARLKRHDFAGAFTDFEKADACRRPGWDGRSRFCMAYCLNRLDRHLEAIPFYTQAIQAGFDPAPAYNNRAFSLWKRRKMNYNDFPQDLEDASRDLDEAIDRDPNLPAARYNHALLALVRRLGNPKLLLSDTALADIRLVLDASPAKTRELYRDAADLYALAILDDFRRRVALSLPAGFGHADLIRQWVRFTLPEAPLAELAVECVERAIAEGQDPIDFARNPFVQRALGDLPAFQRVLQLQPGTRSTPPGAQLCTQLVEPDSQLPD